MVDVTLGSKNDGAGFTRDYVTASEQRINTSATVAYTAGHSVKEVGLWVRAAPSVDTSINVSIYDISGGAPNAPLVYTTQITVPTTVTINAYFTQALTGDLSALTGGETLALHLSSSDQPSPGIPGRRVGVSTSFGSSGFTPIDPWVQASTNGTESPDAYFILGDAGPAGPSLTITDPIIPGTTTTFSTSGNEDPWTGVRITDSEGNVKELTLASQTSVSAPAVGDLDYALFGDVTVEVYNATESAEATIAFDPPSGFSNLALEAGFVTTQESFLFEYGGTPAVPDQFTYDPIASDTGETLTLGSDGLWTATGYGTWTVYGSDATDGEMQSFQFVWEAVAGAVGKLTRRNLTRRTLTRRSLTART